MNSAAKILLIEDDPGIVMTLRRVLTDEGHDVGVETRGDTGLTRARDDGFDVIITDMKLPGLNGLDLVRELHVAKPRLPIILMTAYGTTETAIEATKSGAYDYLVKPFEMPELIELVEKAVTSRRLMTRPVQLGASGDARDALIGNSRAMQAIYKEIGRNHILEPTYPFGGRNVAWSAASFANRCMFARNDKELVCISLAVKP